MNRGISQGDYLIILRQPILLLGGYGSLRFDGTKVTSFLRTITRAFKNHGVTDDQECKETMADYATSANKRLIKCLTRYSDPNVT
jgi:hypothetical protein